MLDDGAPYNQIVAALAELGHTVSARNISNWFQGGHQDWLLHQERLAANRIREEAVLDILTNDTAIDLPAAGLQIAATHLCQLLLAAHPESADPESGLNNYIRVANALCRITRQLLRVHEFRQENPHDEALEPQSSIPDPPSTLPPLKVQSSAFDVQGSAFSSHAPPDQPSDSPPSSILNPPPSILHPSIHSSTNPPAAAASPFSVQSSKFKVQCSDPPAPPIHQSKNPSIHQSAAQPLRGR
jgi:hypothetical protein